MTERMVNMGMVSCIMYRDQQALYSSELYRAALDANFDAIQPGKNEMVVHVLANGDGNNAVSFTTNGDHLTVNNVPDCYCGSLGGLQHDGLLMREHPETARFLEYENYDLVVMLMM